MASVLIFNRMSPPFFSRIIPDLFGWSYKKIHVPLRHTTPFFGTVSLAYAAKKVKSEFFIKFSGKRSFENLPMKELNYL